MAGAQVGTEHILIGIITEGDNYAIRFLSELGVDIPSLANRLMDVVGLDDVDENKGAEKPTFSPKNTPKNKGKTSTQNVDKFGHDLTADAKAGKLDPVIGRADEIERVIQILCRRTKNNPCLIGEPGVGKTAIAEGLAQKIAGGDIPDILKNKRLITLDLTGMVAGTKYRGDFEERIKAIIEEVTQSDDIILFIKSDRSHVVL